MKHDSRLQKLLKRVTAKDTPPKPISYGDQKRFSKKLSQNDQDLRLLLGTSPDVVYRTFPIKYEDGRTRDALIIYIDGLVFEMAVRESVLEPLVAKPFNENPQEALSQLQERISTKRITEESTISKAIEEILKGKLLLLIDEFDLGLIVHVEAFEFLRAVQEPDSEKTVRGARDGFIESVAVNMSLLRRRISHPALQFDVLKVGEISQTTIVISYIKGIVDPELVNHVKERIQKIKMDAIHSSGDIEQLIEDHPYSIFATIGNTERPDNASSMLLDGRIIILVDGDPFCLYVPLFFLDNIKHVEDYNSRPYYGSIIRLMRFTAFLISCTLPAVYLSALNFNKETIPSDLIVPIIQAREMVPFSLWMEVFLMILMFEVVREAGVRLPQQVGAALSIVGALILGQVAVQAGVVGAPTIIVVSVSYIAEFIITPIVDITALLRIGFLIASAIFGPFGLFVAALGLMTHMVSLTSLGVPYMAPFAPIYFRDFLDSIIRAPTRWLRTRPKSIPNKRPEKIHSLPDTGEKK